MYIMESKPLDSKQKTAKDGSHSTPAESASLALRSEALSHSDFGLFHQVSTLQNFSSN